MATYDNEAVGDDKDKIRVELKENLTEKYKSKTTQNEKLTGEAILKYLNEKWAPQ